MTKLFDYFRIDITNKQGIKIEVKSKVLKKFFQDFNFDLLCYYRRNNQNTLYYGNNSLIDENYIIGDSYLRTSLKYEDKPRFSASTELPQFLSGSMPYMGFLTDENIDSGISFTMDMPITRQELNYWYIKVVEYSQRLKKTIDRKYETLIEVENQ